MGLFKYPVISKPWKYFVRKFLVRYVFRMLGPDKIDSPILSNLVWEAIPDRWDFLIWRYYILINYHNMFWRKLLKRTQNYKIYNFLGRGPSPARHNVKMVLYLVRSGVVSSISTASLADAPRRGSKLVGMADLYKKARSFGDVTLCDNWFHGLRVLYNHLFYYFIIKTNTSG